MGLLIIDKPIDSSGSQKGLGEEDFLFESPAENLGSREVVLCTGTKSFL